MTKYIETCSSDRNRNEHPNPTNFVSQISRTNDTNFVSSLANTFSNMTPSHFINQLI